MIDEKNKIQKTFGCTLQRIRKQASLSQEELSLQAGYDRTYVSMLERGIRNPSLTTIINLAETLSIHPKELLQDF